MRTAIQPLEQKRFQQTDSLRRSKRRRWLPIPSVNSEWQRSLESSYTGNGRPQLASDSRLQKLSFTVDRTVRVKAWAARGERLFDLRKQPFSGNGAIALRRAGDGFEITAARPAGLDRPWARGSAAPPEATSAAVRTQPRDATPRADDLEAGD